MWDTLMELRER